MDDSLGDAVEKTITQAGPIDLSSGKTRARVQVVDTDRLGVVVDQIRVDSGPGDLKDRAERLSQNMRPGGERLLPVEVAPNLGGAILRSDPRDMRRGRFFQVDLDTTGAEITRLRVDDEGQRQPEPYGLTRDQLGHLINDLVDGLAKPDMD